MNPIARQENLVIRRDTGELYITDLMRNELIHLNPTSAYVWEKCDGNHNSADIAQEIQNELGVKVSLGLIDSTINRLLSARLLETRQEFA